MEYSKQTYARRVSRGCERKGSMMDKDGSIRHDVP